MAIPNKQLEVTCKLNTFLFHFVWFVFVLAFTENSRFDNLIGRRSRGIAGIAALYFCENFPTFDHAAKRGMATIEMRGAAKGEEEL